MAMAPVRRSRRAVVIGLVLLVLFGSSFIANFYTDVLWFQEVGFTSVLWKSLGTQWAVGLVSGIVVALLIWINLAIASRVSPVYRTLRIEVSGIDDPVARYRESLAPYIRWLRLAVAVFFGLLTGFVASTRWTTFLLYLNRVQFGENDPQFGKDVGFYVFELPFFNFIASEVWSALAAALFVSVVAHFFYGSIRPQLGLRGVTAGALAHISVLLGLLALVKAVQYWLGRYELNFSARGVVDGASYTDVNAQLPALNLLVVISIVSALLFLANIRFRRLSLPLAAVGIWILTSFLAGGVWPWAVQRFSVEPQELPRERPYIQRNIQATQQAFGLAEVETRPFAATDALEQADLAANQTLLQNVRVWDPGILAQGYEQLQAIRPYYEFPDVDIDRYVVDGEPRQILLAARELSLENLEERSQTWANLHLQYTHGYGLVASLANAATAAGQPSFIVQGVPGDVSEGAEALAADQARLYYGETFDSDQYSVVRSGQKEIDYPTNERPQRSRYDGEGGVPVGGFLRKLAFAIRESDANLILSNLIDEDSRIIFYRDIFDRVLRAAPFLNLDADPYIANIDGRLVWILDGYTATNWYPYSQQVDAGVVLGSSATDGRLHGEINYLRNSVKIVVDAYDGTMKFYVIDEDDALIQAWRKAFPVLFAKEEPSPDLQAHFRYPEDLFKLQSEVFTTYHINDPNDFYSKEDVWAIPTELSEIQVDPTVGQTITGEPSVTDPTYLLIQLPQEPEEEFLLARPFTPRARNNMISFMVGRSDPGKYGELVILQFPRQKLVEGPNQIDNLINQDVEVSRTLTLLGQEGSDVAFGSLVILPIEESILYVRPLFVTAETLGIPELKRVLLVFGEQVVMADNFEEGLAELFGAGVPAEDGAEPPKRPGAGERPAPTGELGDLIREAAALYQRAQEALADGDFEEYGRLIEELGRVLQQANR
jgi:uncharacterized membrane protein (UPF0182 family)